MGLAIGNRPLGVLTLIPIDILGCSSVIPPGPDRRPILIPWTPRDGPSSPGSSRVARLSDFCGQVRKYLTEYVHLSN